MFAQSPDDTGRRLWAQRFGNDVGIEQVPHGLRPEVAARACIPNAFQKLRRVEGEIGEIDRFHEFLIGFDEAAPARDDSLESSIPDQNHYRFATPREACRPALFRFSDRPRQVAATRACAMCRVLLLLPLARQCGARSENRGSVLSLSRRDAPISCGAGVSSR